MPRVRLGPRNRELFQLFDAAASNVCNGHA
jgi:hypothetical protein